MAEHITDPRVMGGMFIISSDDDHVTITGSEMVNQPVWIIEFGVKDGKIYVVRDTAPHLSAYGVLDAAEVLSA